MKLADSVSKIPGVGETYQKKLQKLEIFTVYDLLHHIPRKYLDARNAQKIKALKPGEKATIEGVVTQSKNTYTKSGKQIQAITISDGQDQMYLVWFNQPYILQTLKEGELISAIGKVAFWNKKKAIFFPQYEKVKPGQETIHSGKIIPLYPETAGVNSKWLRSIVRKSLNLLEKQELKDFVNKKDTKQHDLTSFRQAIKSIHWPENQNTQKRALERLSFNELLEIQIANNLKKIKWKEKNKAVQIQTKPTKINSFIKKLDFNLTNSQTKAIEEILTDLKKPFPMSRLLEGDVGSGKTIVAATAIYANHIAGNQSILLAPTTTLANQHFNTLKSLFENHNLKITISTSSKKMDIKSSHIFIGTHALLHKNFINENVSLIVIDEQHRFGVKQRAKIKSLAKKEFTPHILTMTATPIPRTMALTLYGDLDLTSLNEMPKGRKEITTWVVPPNKKEKALKWIRDEIKLKKTQAFFIYPLIDESEHEMFENIPSATQEYQNIQKILPDLKIGLLHGKMKAKQKEETLNNFRNKKLDILISTPVIEVGIDIPSATIMLIEAADRFGLAQLHQLRGRIGRNSEKSYCLLLPSSNSKTAQKRLLALTQSHSGKELAEIDLSFRGPGEVFGIRQHGATELKIAQWDNTELIKKASKFAKQIIDNPTKHKKTIQYFKNKQIAEN